MLTRLPLLHRAALALALVVAGTALGGLATLASGRGGVCERPVDPSAACSTTRNPIGLLAGAGVGILLAAGVLLAAPSPPLRHRH